MEGSDYRNRVVNGLTTKRKYKGMGSIRYGKGQRIGLATAEPSTSIGEGTQVNAEIIGKKYADVSIPDGVLLADAGTVEVIYFPSPSSFLLIVVVVFLSGSPHWRRKGESSREGMRKRVERQGFEEEGDGEEREP